MVKEKKGRSFSQDLQLLNINLNLVPATLLGSGKEVGGWTGGYGVAKSGLEPRAPYDEA